MEKQKELTVEFEILKTALEEIVDPIKFMRKRLQPDERLNGTMAVLISQDHNHLKQIAKDALEKVNQSKNKNQ